MADQNSNDNDVIRADGALHGPDAHGQAAMLLVESLIHGLVARDVINVTDAVEIVAVAAEVKADIAAEIGDAPANLCKSITLLAGITASLSKDLPDGTGQQRS